MRPPIINHTSQGPNVIHINVVPYGSEGQLTREGQSAFEKFTSCDLVWYLDITARNLPEQSPAARATKSIALQMVLTCLARISTV